jgi:uncharacterized membrane protein HdeD (DUF308 family)
MADPPRGDLTDVLSDALTDVGKHWLWVLAFGVITALVGLIALVWPGRTLVVIAVLFGIELVVAGIFRFVAAFAAGDESGATRVLFALLGVLSFIVGLYAIRHLVLTIAALAVILGIFWIVHGLVEVFAALSDRAMPGRGWAIVTGVLGIVVGVWVLAVPQISLFTVTVVLGAWLLVFGVIEIVMAFRLRGAAPSGARVATAS